MIAAVRVMAQGAIFGHRCVFPQVWTAFLGMTGIAGIVNRGTDQQGIVITIVRIVTITAGHLSKTEWVAAVSECFRTGTRMA